VPTADIVWLLPAAQEKDCGVVYPCPSTVTDNPEGAVAIVTEPAGAKCAETLFETSIVTNCGLVEPLSAPEKYENTYPAFADALTSTTSFKVRGPVGGEIVQAPGGSTAVVKIGRAGAGEKLPVTLLFAVIVTFCGFVLPVKSPAKLEN
jgi:hypothetical protein